MSHLIITLPSDRPDTFLLDGPYNQSFHHGEYRGLPFTHLLTGLPLENARDLLYLYHTPEELLPMWVKLGGEVVYAEGMGTRAEDQ